MNDYDPILQRLEVEDAAKHERVRQVLYEAGRPDLVAELDAKMRDIRTGVAMAQSAWHSISPAQRLALQFAAHPGCNLRRVGNQYLAAAAIFRRPERPIRVPTVRNLCARELLAWNGGAFDPEGAAVITERGLFTLAHGRPAEAP
jgi:hypothetical protein